MALEMPGASQPAPLKEISSRDLEEAGFYGLLRNANGLGIVVRVLLSHMVTLTPSSICFVNWLVNG